MSYQSLDDQVIFEKNDSVKEGSNESKKARIGVFLVISLIFVATASIVLYSDQNFYNKNLRSFFSLQTIPGDNIHSQDALTILSKSGLDSAEKQIQGDVTFEDLNSIDLQPQETRLNEVSADTPEDNAPPSYLCSLDDPDQDESLNCEHKATSIFMKASQDGAWPHGFSWALLSDFSASGGGLSVAHSEKGAFRQNQNLVCDEYVKQMCINGDYILYASSEDSSLDSDLFVDVCEHSYQIKPGQAVQFTVERGVCSSSGQIIPESKFESLSLIEHVSQFDAEENVNKKIDNQEAVPVKLSDREITRKKQQLASLTKKEKLGEDRVNYDSDKIKYDEGQIKRFKDDVKIEEELLEIFNRKVDKVKQNLDEDQEKLVKDEKNVELIKNRKNQLEQNINDPYVPKDGEAGDDEEDEDENGEGKDEEEDEDQDEDEDEDEDKNNGEEDEEEGKEDEDQDEEDEEEGKEGDEDEEDEDKEAKEEDGGDGEAQGQNKDQEEGNDQQNSEGQEADDQNKKDDQSGIIPISSPEDGSSNSSITDDGSAQEGEGSEEGSDGSPGGNQTLDGGDGGDGGGQVVETQAQKEERCKNAIIKFICYAEHPKSKPSSNLLRYRL